MRCLILTLIILLSTNIASFGQTQDSVGTNTRKSETSDEVTSARCNTIVRGIDVGRIPALVYKDIIIDAHVYRVSITEFTVNNEIEYNFTIKSAEGNCQNFQVTDVKSNAYSRQIVQSKLTDKIKELRKTKLEDNNPTAPTFNSEPDTVAIKSIQPLLSSSRENRSLTPFERQSIFTLLDKSRGSDQLLKALDTLSRRVSLADSIEIQQQIAIKMAVKEITNQSEAEGINQTESLEITTTVTDLMEAASTEIYRRNQRGSRVGMMSFQKKVNSYQTPDKKNKSGGQSGKTTYLDKIPTGWFEFAAIVIAIRKILSDEFTALQPQGSTKSDEGGSKNSNSIYKPIIIEEVEVVIEEGQIAKIQVLAHPKDDVKTRIRFQNRLPIPFSSKSGVSRDFYGQGRRAQKLWTSENRESNNWKGKYILLEDIMNYDYYSENYTSNYAPVDTVFRLKPNEPGRHLFRPSIVNVLDLKTFTDLVGLDADESNGILQIEFDKRIPLNRIVRSFRGWGHPRFPLKWDWGYTHYTFLSHLKPFIAFTNLEEDDRLINVDSISIDGKTNPADSISIIDFVQNQNLVLGTELNLLSIGAGDIYSKFTVDAGIAVHRTGFSSQNFGEVIIGDTTEMRLLDDDPVNDFNVIAASILLPRLAWEFRPHSKYFTELSYECRYFQLFDDRVSFLKGEKLLSSNRTMHSFQFLAGLRVVKQKASMLFFRSRFNMLGRENNENFLQIQVGVATSFFSVPRELPIADPFK